ncbi:MAG: hypothetical protein ABJP76_12220 [Flavobacteriaceae bacterium]
MALQVETHLLETVPEVTNLPVEQLLAVVVTADQLGQVQEVQEPIEAVPVAVQETVVATGVPVAAPPQEAPEVIEVLAAVLLPGAQEAIEAQEVQVGLQVLAGLRVLAQGLLHLVEAAEDNFQKII